MDHSAVRSRTLGARWTLGAHWLAPISVSIGWTVGEMVQAGEWAIAALVIVLTIACFVGDVLDAYR